MRKVIEMHYCKSHPLDYLTDLYQNEHIHFSQYRLVSFESQKNNIFVVKRCGLRRAIYVQHQIFHRTLTMFTSQNFQPTNEPTFLSKMSSKSICFRVFQHVRTFSTATACTIKVLLIEQYENVTEKIIKQNRLKNTYKCDFLCVCQVGV